MSESAAAAPLAGMQRCSVVSRVTHVLWHGAACRLQYGRIGGTAQTTDWGYAGDAGVADAEMEKLIRKKIGYRGYRPMDPEQRSELRSKHRLGTATGTAAGTAARTAAQTQDDDGDDGWDQNGLEEDAALHLP